MTDPIKPRSPITAAIARKTRNEIDEQVAAFLKKGGQIEQVPNGVSGQVSSVRRAIPLVNKLSKKK